MINLHGASIRRKAVKPTHPTHHIHSPMQPAPSRLARVASHMLPKPQPRLAAAAAGSEKVGFGIVGAGDIAKQSFAPALLGSSEAELVAVCRRDEAQAKEFALEHGGGCAAYGSIMELLEDPAVTAVVIATPTHTHAELCVLAAKHGKHVLVEKPMARNVAECEQMIAACAAAGVSLGVCYRRRTFPQVVKAKELIASGAIGDVLTVRTHCSALQVQHQPIILNAQFMMLMQISSLFKRNSSFHITSSSFLM